MSQYNWSIVPASEVEISGNTATPDEQQTLIIECRVIANPPATFEWSRDGEVLNDSTISTTNNFTSTDGPTSTSILTVRNVTVNDGGDYVCTAENNLSTSPVSAYFTVNVTGELQLTDHIILIPLAWKFQLP
jgi:hypothetical protein